MHRRWVARRHLSRQNGMRRLVGPQFDRIITGARRLDGDRIAIPGVTLLLAGIPVDMATMLAPIE